MRGGTRASPRKIPGAVSQSSSSVSSLRVAAHEAQIGITLLPET